MSSLVRPLTQVLGIVFTLLAITGFFMGGFLFFEGDMYQNIIYLTVGLIGLWAAVSGKERFYLLLLAVIFGALAVLGFMGGNILGLFDASDMETYAHTAVAVVALVVGTSRKN